MTVPAGNIRGIETRQPLAFDNNVFEYFVDSMADMDFAVGIGRAIVQNEAGLPRILSNLAIEFFFLPSGELLRLSLGQIAFHWKIGGRKIERGFVVHSSRNYKYEWLDA